MPPEAEAGGNRWRWISAVAGESPAARTRGWPLVVLGLLLVCTAWMQWQRVSFASVDSQPFPDALEYSVSAVSLAEGRGLVLPMGVGVYPPRYPYGFPAILAGAHLIRLPEIRFHLVSGLCGLLLILIVYALSRRVGGGPGSSLIAAAIVATSPQLLDLSSLVLSDLAYLVVLLSAFLLFPTSGPKPGRGVDWIRLVLSGAAVGFSIALRLVGVVLLPVLLLVAAWPHRRDRDRRLAPLTAAVLFLIGCSIFLIPQLLFNLFNFGNPLTTGYAYWVELYESTTKLFSPHFVAGTEYPTFGNLHYYANLLGGLFFNTERQRLYSPAVFLLAASGLLLLTRISRLSRLHKGGAAVLLAQLLFLQFYYGAQVRLIVLAVPWAAIWAGEAFRLIWRRPAGAPLRRTLRGTALLACTVALLHPLGFCVAGAPAHHRWTEHRLPHSVWLNQVTPDDALVLSNISPAMVELRLQGRSGREWIQLSDNDGQHTFRVQLRAFRGHGPPLPQARFVQGTSQPQDTLRPLFQSGRMVRWKIAATGDGQHPARSLFTTDRWRSEQIQSALSSGKPVFAAIRPDAQTGERLLAELKRIYRLEPSGRMRGVRLFRITARQPPPPRMARSARPTGPAAPRAAVR